MIGFLASLPTLKNTEKTGMYGGFQGALNWVSLMPRDASLSDSNKSVGGGLLNYISISFQIEWDMIVVTGFLSIFNQMDFHLVQNRKENCHHDHIPFHLKGNRIQVFSVCDQSTTFK